jgi:hypothetical protein
MRASAPMRTPLAPFSVAASIAASGSALTSTTCAGRSTVHFIRSTRFVPPAMNFAASREPERIASGTLATRT